jgi:hypothetical protein
VMVRGKSFIETLEAHYPMLACPIG